MTKSIDISTNQRMTGVTSTTFLNGLVLFLPIWMSLCALAVALAGAYIPAFIMAVAALMSGYVAAGLMVPKEHR